jgi:hypothetical protein
MTDEERRELEEILLSFGLLATTFLLAALGAGVLAKFLLRLKRNDPIQGSFESLRGQTREILQTDFERIVEELARLAQSDIATWESTMAETIEGYLLAQATSARGRPLLPSELLAINDGPVRTQTDYLSRFADSLRNNLFTETGVAARAKLYSGAGRALWYRISEEDVLVGWIIDYVSVDDRGTCLPCVTAEADGPYLFGEGPFPGEVCLGRGRCRCHRQPRFDETAWSALAA